MNPSERQAAWADFIHAFFSAPNELSAVGDEAIEGIIAQAAAAWLATPAGPFFLPVSASNWTYWYAICPDEEQRLWVRDLIRAYIGSWSDTGGPPIPKDSDVPLDRAVRELIGPEGCAFRLLIPRDSNAESSVRQSLGRLTRLLAERPYRRIQLTKPLGRLIGDFWDACASSAQASAEEVLTLLEQDRRLSKANRLFLRLQYLATFEEWDDLEALDQLPDLVRLDRPVLASDAMARLAMVRVDADADLTAFKQSTVQFGCLINSTTSIRSPASAQYYAYWALASGEAAEIVAERLLEAGWLAHAQQHNGLALLLSGRGEPAAEPSTAPHPDDVRQAVVEGRLDAAIGILARLRPSAELLPILIDLVTRTLSSRAVELLQRWRASLGESLIEEALSHVLKGSIYEFDLASQSLAEAIGQTFSECLRPGERARALDALRAQAVPRLMQAGELREVIEAVRSASRSLDPVLLRDLIDLMLDMERDLFGAAGDVSGIQDLRLLIVETWALGDESGERHRAFRVLDVVSRTLDMGISRAAFDELVETLRAAWTPFLTDADLPFGVETIEVLGASQPEDAVALQAFATMILSRIGRHNVRRIDTAVLDTAMALATEFGLELAIPAESLSYPSDSGDRIRVPAGTFVILYSLMESAVRRAAAIMRQNYPDIRVETLAEKVANPELRKAASEADLLVIADKAAAHAATDALKAARGRKLTCYARGKGSVSLVEAANAGLRMLSARTASVTS